jgi:hypothetical protein
LLETSDVPDDFTADRPMNTPPVERDLFRDVDRVGRVELVSRSDA